MSTRAHGHASPSLSLSERGEGEGEDEETGAAVPASTCRCLLLPPPVAGPCRHYTGAATAVLTLLVLAGVAAALCAQVCALTVGRDGRQVVVRGCRSVLRRRRVCRPWRHRVHLLHGRSAFDALPTPFSLSSL